MEKSTNFRYIEWKSPDEMHYSAQQWTSSLDFIEDEHHFFDDMLKEYTMPILKADLFSEVKALITELDESKRNRQELRQKVGNHLQGLKILLDGIDQPNEEKKYKEQHRNLLKEVENFTKSFRQLKTKIFSKVSQALKTQKQKLLLK